MSSCPATLPATWPPRGTELAVCKIADGRRQPIVSDSDCQGAFENMSERDEASVEVGSATVGIVKRITVSADPERDLHGPAVVRAGNGDLLLSHQDSITHSGKDGFCRQWRSTDSGMTWRSS